MGNSLAMDPPDQCLNAATKRESTPSRGQLANRQVDFLLKEKVIRKDLQNEADKSGRTLQSTIKTFFSDFQ